MIAAWDIELTAQETVALCGLGGEALFGLTLALLREVAPDVASLVHDLRGPKPLSISPLEGSVTRAGGQTVLSADCTAKFQVCALSEDVAQAVQRSLDAARDCIVALGRGRAAVTLAEPVVQTSYGALRSQASKGYRISLRFVSPTSFRRRGKQVIWPFPELVFGSLLQRWNAFSSIQIPSSYLSHNGEIKVSRYSVRTELVEFGQYRVIGFTGEVEFTLPSAMPARIRQMINALADYAYFAGVGYKTSMGLGQCRRL